MGWDTSSIDLLAALGLYLAYLGSAVALLSMTVRRSWRRTGVIWACVVCQAAAALVVAWDELWPMAVTSVVFISLACMLLRHPALETAASK